MTNVHSSSHLGLEVDGARYQNNYALNGVPDGVSGRRVDHAQREVCDLVVKVVEQSGVEGLELKSRLRAVGNVRSGEGGKDLRGG